MWTADDMSIQMRRPGQSISKQRIPGNHGSTKQVANMRTVQGTHQQALAFPACPSILYYPESRQAPEIRADHHAPRLFHREKCVSVIPEKCVYVATVQAPEQERADAESDPPLKMHGFQVHVPKTAEEHASKKYLRIGFGTHLQLALEDQASRYPP